MSKWFRAAVLVVAAVAWVGFSMQSGESVAQEKKKTTGVVKVNEGKDGKFRLSIYDSKNKFLVSTPVGHATKADALKIVESLKAAIENPEFVDTKADKKGKAKGN